MTNEEKAELLLLLLPYITSHPDGVPIDELVERFEIDRKRVIQLLNSAQLVGPPDGTPDEYLDVLIEDDRAFAFLPHAFERPIRFNIRETWALLLALTPMAEAPLPQLATAARSLRERLLENVSRNARGLADLPSDLPQIDEAGDASNAERSAYALIERAVRERRRIRADYWSKSRDVLEERLLEPCLILTDRSHYYLITSDEKAYHFGRFRSVTLLDERFEVPESFNPEAIRKRRFGTIEGASFRILEGGVERELAGPFGSGAAAYLREGRGERVLVDPPEARASFIEETKEILARYERSA